MISVHVHSQVAHIQIHNFGTNNVVLRLNYRFPRNTLNATFIALTSDA